MRIISGKCRGTVLNTLEGSNTRPTLDRVKESIFNILGNRLDDLYVLDLFAGSGALGLEALSRGAAFCDFVDLSKEAVYVINKNIDKCHMREFSKIYQGDFLDVIKKLSDDKYDVVFLDPPYGHDIGTLAIENIDKLVKDAGIIVLETDYIDKVNDNIGSFVRYDVRKYGRVVISFFRKVGC